MSDHQQRVRFGAEAFFEGDMVQVFGDLRRGDAAKVEALTARFPIY